MGKRAERALGVPHHDVPPVGIDDDLGNTRQHEMRLLAATLIMAAVIFLICETAFYLSSPLTMTERRSGSTQQNRTVEPRSMPAQRKQ